MHPSSSGTEFCFQHHAFFPSYPTTCGFPPRLKQPCLSLIHSESADSACNTYCDVPCHLEQVWCLSLQSVWVDLERTNSTLACLTFLIFSKNIFSLIWFSQLPRTVALNSNWGIPLLSKKLVLFVLCLGGYIFVLIFWLLYLCSHPYFVPAYLSFLEGTRPLVQQAVVSKAQLQARREAFCQDFPLLTPSKPAFAVPPGLVCSTAEFAFLSLV